MSAAARRTLSLCNARAAHEVTLASGVRIRPPAAVGPPRRSLPFDRAVRLGWPAGRGWLDRGRAGDGGRHPDRSGGGGSRRQHRHAAPMGARRARDLRASRPAALSQPRRAGPPAARALGRRVRERAQPPHGYRPRRAARRRDGPGRHGVRAEPGRLGHVARGGRPARPQARRQRDGGDQGDDGRDRAFVTETPPGTGDLPTLRHEYDTHGLEVAGLDRDPLVQFGRWFEDAAAEGVYEPHAVALATVGPDGHPPCRYVLRRGVDDRGFRFFTSYGSAKARDLDATGVAALTWGWLELHRQVRATGRVRRLDPRGSDASFASRPRGSQIAAWASPQSAVLADRAELERRVSETEARFADGPVP